MPELPEVETIKNYIKPLIEGDSFISSEIHHRKLRINIPENFEEVIINNKILSVIRKAKYIIINLNNNISILFHFGMTGNITIYDKKPKKDKHDHVVLKLASQKYLSFNDQRKFGLVTYIKSNNLANSKFFTHLGIEPLDNRFNGQYLKKIIANKAVEIKKFIMEQKNIVGVGNIYAAEALFLSKINPLLAANEISLKECTLLCKNIKSILLKAIEKGGSTIKNYKSADGNSGYFQYEFNVYGRANKPCNACKTPIKRLVQSGRSTFYCPKCQTR